MPVWDKIFLKSNLVALAYFAGFIMLLILAWVLDLPKKPILYYGSVFVGPILFLIMGALRSWKMALVHAAALTASALFVYIHFNQAMTIQKQMTYSWPPLLLGLFVLFCFIHLRTEKDV